MLLNLSGDVVNAVIISQGTTNFDMYTAQNGLINMPSTWEREDYFFAGWSRGFKTKY